MAITVGTSTVTSGQQTTGFTLVINSGVVAGDILLLGVTNRGATADPSVTDDDSGGNTWAKVANQNADTNGAGTVWWKRATSATASKTITVSGCTNSASGCVTPYTGALASGTPYGTPVSESNASGNNVQAGLTVGTANSFVCLFVHCTSNDTLNPNTYTATDPTTLTERAEGVSAGGSDCSCSHASAVKTSTGATGNLGWSQTSGTGASIAFELIVQTATEHTTSLAADGGGSVVIAASTREVPAGAVAADGGSTATMAASTRETFAALAADAESVATVGTPSWQTSTAVAADGDGAATVAATQETFTSLAADGGSTATVAATRETATSVAAAVVSDVSIAQSTREATTVVAADGSSSVIVAATARETTTSLAADGESAATIAASTRGVTSSIIADAVGAAVVAAVTRETFSAIAADGVSSIVIVDATVSGSGGPTNHTTSLAVDNECFALIVAISVYPEHLTMTGGGHSGHRRNFNQRRATWSIIRIRPPRKDR